MSSFSVKNNVRIRMDLSVELCLSVDIDHGIKICLNRICWA